jgi:uncharacterized oxidoreductase
MPTPGKSAPRSAATWSSSRAPGDEVLLPGEPERRTRAERLASGIPVDATTWDQIIASGVQVGLERADLEAIAA